MKKILGIVIGAILLFIIIMNFKDDNNLKDKSNLFRVEENKVESTLFFSGLKRKISLNL